jgi:hypothetical protein
LESLLAGSDLTRAVLEPVIRAEERAQRDRNQKDEGQKRPHRLEEIARGRRNHARGGRDDFIDAHGDIFFGLFAFDLSSPECLKEESKSGAGHDAEGNEVYHVFENGVVVEHGFMNSEMEFDYQRLKHDPDREQEGEDKDRELEKRVFHYFLKNINVPAAAIENTPIWTSITM